jgi:uncharacterized RDD family membrane protein YckC
MNTSMLRRYISLAMVSAAALALISLFAASGTRAAEPQASAAAATPAAAMPDSPASAAPAPDEWPERTEEDHSHHHWHGHHGSGNHQVNIGHDSHLAQGETAEVVVSVFGSSTSEGEAGNVVSVLGDTRVTGEVTENAVAVLGSNYIDGKVDGDAVAVMGDMELGPHAEIGGDVVAVGGNLQRDPAAIIHGSVQNVLGGEFGSLHWLHTWIRHCLLYGRPLAFAPGLGWAWGLALAFLALYVGLALLFREGLSRCVRTFETQPGRSILAGLIAALLTPVLLVLLCITVIGIAAIPFAAFGLICVGLFGKAVMLAWLGGRIAGRSGVGAIGHPAVAVLIGGVLVLILYVVPVLGFLVYKVLGFLGLGAVVYTVILDSQANRAAKSAPASASPHTAAPLNSEARAFTAATAADAATAAAAPEAPAAAAPAAAAATSSTVSAALPRAGFLTRMAALLIDVLLVGVLLHLLGSHHLELLVLAAYGAVMWKLRGSTVGGIVFDLRVVRLDGREVDWETAIIRALSCFLSLAVAGLGFFWIAIDDNSQAWHDKIAGTVVVRVPKGVPLV